MEIVFVLKATSDLDVRIGTFATKWTAITADAFRATVSASKTGKENSAIRRYLVQVLITTGMKLRTREGGINATTPAIAMAGEHALPLGGVKVL